MNTAAPHGFKIGIQMSQVTNDAMGGASENVCELYFTDTIQNRVSFWTGEEISMLQECIDAVNDAKPDRIIQYIDSWGGSAPVGMGVYNYLKGHKAKVETKILNNCASIASVMAMAGNKGKISMPRNGMMVIHQAQNSAQGTSAELREAADLCDKYTEQVLDVYVLNNRKGKTRDELYNCIKDGDYWMTGQEAMDMGFVDCVYNDESVTITNSVNLAKTVYNNIPQRILDMATAEVKPEVPQEHKSFFESITNAFNTLKMDVTNIIAGVKKDLPTNGITADASTKLETLFTNFTNAIGKGVQDDITAAVTTATAAVAEGVTASETKYKGIIDSLTTQVTALADSITKLTAEVATANASVTEAKETITAQETTIKALTADVQQVQGRPAADANKPDPNAKKGLSAYAKAGNFQ